jgi:hypothetical protein
MTRFKALFAAVVGAAVAAAVPATAQTFHFVGAGSSAQFTMAAIATDQAALNENSAVYDGAETVSHWTLKNGAQISDNRDSLGRILPEVGNISIVWLTNSGGTVTDIWAVDSVDSTVGVRSFSAVEPNGQGALLQIIVAAGTAGGNLVGPSTGALWPDNTPDAALAAAVLAAFGGQATSGTSATFGPHVSVGLTDIRPEDALYATTRSYSALNTTTWAGLGYQGPTKYIGAPIYTAQGTGTVATPIGFGLSGVKDPIYTKGTVADYVTVPIGAAPIVFIQNNGGNANYPIDVTTGVVPGETGGPYNLAHLFDGTTAATTNNPAFDAFEGGTVPSPNNITVFLREPLSGTMNTTEFGLFRSDKNDDDSQEVGVTNPTRAPYNPLNLATTGGGNRERSIGTGEVVGKSGTGGYGVLGNAYSIGYIFWGFSNALKLVGADFNYLTVDGVDPIGLPASLTPGQTFTGLNTSATDYPASLWTGSNTFPNLRNGTYKAWSIYRWLIADSNLGSDPYGYDAVAQIAQDYVDSDVTDFVPFATSTGSDGLSVYHSHFKQTNAGDNGAATSQNSFNDGNTLGGTTEAGGDEGGLIEGPFGVTLPTTNGYATWAITLTAKKGYKVTWKSGPKFTAGTSWEGAPITLGNAAVSGSSQTVANVAVTTTTLYVANPNPSGSATIEVPFSIGFTSTFSAATAPGVLDKKQ